MSDSPDLISDAMILTKSSLGEERDYVLIFPGLPQPLTNGFRVRNSRQKSEAETKKECNFLFVLLTGLY